MRSYSNNLGPAVAQSLVDPATIDESVRYTCVRALCRLSRHALLFVRLLTADLCPFRRLLTVRFGWEISTRIGSVGQRAFQSFSFIGLLSRFAQLTSCSTD